jgi:hypothetical protein
VTVVAFTKKEPPKPRIWVCHCRCEAFWLYEDGRIQCMQCDEFHDTMKGQWSLVVAEPDEPA